jgi:branched-chain amino acid aminotransferase
MNDIAAYLNGEWIPVEKLHISVDDAGFLLGATVTERLRTFGGVVFRPDEHLRRLRHSLDIVGLETDAITNQIAGAVPEFLRRNKPLIAAEDDWSIVAFATPGIVGARQPTVCVHGYPLPFARWAAQYETGIHVVVSSVRQVPPNCWPPELKCRSRMHFYLADREEAATDPAARAILLDQEGYIAEATTANVLIYRDGEGLISPPHEHILVGVSLGVVRDLAGELGIPFVTRRTTVDDFSSADEAMLASTSVCLLPIVACNAKPIGNGRPGLVFRRLLDGWSKLVGVTIDEQARRFSKREA